MTQCLNCGKKLGEVEIDFCRDCKHRLKIMTSHGKQRKDYNIKLKWSYYELPNFEYSKKNKGYIPMSEEEIENERENNNSFRKKKRK